MDEDSEEVKFVFVRYDGGSLTVDYSELCSPWEAWAFLLEATDMVRLLIDGEPAEADDE